HVPVMGWDRHGSAQVQDSERVGPTWSALDSWLVFDKAPPGRVSDADVYSCASTAPQTAAADGDPTATDLDWGIEASVNLRNRNVSEWLLGWLGAMARREWRGKA